MCIFELVLCGDEEGGEVLGEEPSEGRRVGEQHLNTQNFFSVQNLVSVTLETPATAATSWATAAQPVPATKQFT